MNLRERHYPPMYWLKLHCHIQDPLPLPPPRRTRLPTKKRLESCLLHLYPYLQKFVYSGAIDRKKGEVRSGKIPINPEQFNLIQTLGGKQQYNQIPLLEQIFQFEYDFNFKGYRRGVRHIQFRLQTQKSVILGKKPVLLLRVRFQQKPPVLNI